MTTFFWMRCVNVIFLATAAPQLAEAGENQGIASPDANLAGSAENSADGGVVDRPSIAVSTSPEGAGARPLAVWPRRVPSIGPWDWAAVGALAAGTLVLQLTYTPPSSPNWTGGVLFDDWVRRVLRLSSPSARATAASISDFLLYGLVALPFLDAWLGAGLTYQRPDVALRLSVLDAQALLATTFITLGGQHLIQRARPFTTLCVHQPTASECTDGSAQDTSFPSGHTSIAFTVALLECVNHAHLDVDRSGWNGVACPVTLVAASITGLLRIASDRHYASDVIVGGLIGAGIGYLVPTLHFAVAPKNTTTTVVPLLSPGYAGLAFSGAF